METPAAALVDDLAALYARSVSRLRADLAGYLREGRRPDPQARAAGAYAYPELRLLHAPEGARPRPARAFARLNQAGAYAVSLTRPEMFRAYLTEQLELLIADYGVTATTGLSSQEIPYPYVLDIAGSGGDLDLAGAEAADLGRWFPTTQLSHIGDEVADGVWSPALEAARPLALFDAPRVDFSLARLRHYTGAPAEDVQQYVLFTNYHRYVDEFVRSASRPCARPARGSPRCRAPGAFWSRPTRPTPSGGWRSPPGVATRCPPGT